MSTKRDRNHLKTYFETGDRPTEEEFAEFIDSGLNQKEDEIHADGNGNIGIGTENPGAKLEVNGDLIVDDDAQVKGRLIGKDGNASQFLIQSSKQGAAGGAYVHMHGSEEKVNGNPRGNQGGFTFVAAGNGTLNGFDFFHYNIDHSDPQNDGNPETWHRSVRINGHGNVGIGMGGSEPEDKLHVNGTIRTEENIVLKGSLVDHPDNTGNNDVLQIFNNSSVQLYGIDHPNRSGDLYLNTNSSNAGGNIHFNENTGNGWRNNMVIQSGGNVGVGTDDPQSRLHVISPNGSDTGLTLSGQAGINDGDILSTDGTGKVKWVPKTDVTSGLWRKVGSTNHIENGNTENVSIGICADWRNYVESKLVVNGDYEEPLDPSMKGIIRVQGDKGWDAANLRFGVYKDPAKNKGYSWLESINGPLIINNHHIRKVGIGTTQPLAKLEVMAPADNESSNGIIKIAGEDTDKDLRLGVMGDTNPYTWIQSHGAVPLKLNPHSAGNTTTINENGGQVGIGTSSPNARLQVNGTVRIPDNNIYLRDDNDHGIGWFGFSKKFANENIDGPVVFGHSGGALGSSVFGTQKIAMQWFNNGSVDFKNNIRINGHYPMYYQRFIIGDDGNSNHGTNKYFSDYGAAIVVGFAAVNGKIDNGQFFDFYCYTFLDSNDQWVIRADFDSVNKRHENWYVNVMFIRKELVGHHTRPDFIHGTD